MSHLGGGLRSVRTLMRPWAKVAVFSADRAGLLAVADLDAALRAVERSAAESVPWMPRWPDAARRRQALEDFDRSQLMVRRRFFSNPDGGGWMLTPPNAEDKLNAIHRRVRSMFQRSESDAQASEATAESGADAAAQTSEVPVSSEPDEPEAETPPPPEPPPLDEEAAIRLRQALSEAWSLARCDALLTRRMRIL